MTDHDQHPFHPAGFGYVDESHQVHALIIRLFQQFLDPTLIFADVPDRLEVLQKTTDHARHGGDGFQNDSPVTIPFCENLSAETRMNLTSFSAKLSCASRGAMWTLVTCSGAGWWL